MDNTATMLPEEVTDEQVVKYLKENDKKVLEFISGVEAALNNIDFLKDDPWIEHAIKGLEKPDHSERLESQFETTVRKSLRDKAINEAEKTGKPIELPTKDDIAREVTKKMDERKAELNKKMESKLAKARAAIRAAANDQ